MEVESIINIFVSLLFSVITILVRLILKRPDMLEISILTLVTLAVWLSYVKESNKV